jgi:hypothetical protein
MIQIYILKFIRHVGGILQLNPELLTDALHTLIENSANAIWN